MDIGERVKKKRIERDMSQSQLAAVLGVSQELVAKVERGERTPTADLKGKLTRWLATGRGPNRTPAAPRGSYKGYDSRNR